MAGSSCNFGWDLMLKTVERDIKNKEDVLMAVIHWMLIKRGFKCQGLGTEKSGSSSQSGGETLPNGWNSDEQTTIKYSYQDNVYTLHRLKSDSNIIFNLVNVTDLSTSNVTLDVECVTSLNGPLETILSNDKDVLHKIKCQLIEPITQKSSRETETQTERSRSPDLRSSSDSHPLRNILVTERDGRLNPLRIVPRDIGRSDLDPFGGNGGMLFDPFGGGRRPMPPMNPGFGAIGGLPPGSVPPGARFDPIGPLAPGPAGIRRPPPDADHLPPPGYDDMFM